MFENDVIADWILEATKNVIVLLTVTLWEYSLTK